MTYKTIHCCDRCGKKLGWTNEFPVKRHKRVFWTAVFGSRFHTLSGRDNVTEEFDLCYDCESELIRFLNGGEVKGDD